MTLPPGEACAVLPPMPTSTKPPTRPESRTRKKSRSGPSIPEAERSAKLVSIRLSPEDREELEELAKEYGSRSAVVRAGMALLRERMKQKGSG